jgi:hypothetical protein
VGEGAACRDARPAGPPPVCRIVGPPLSGATVDSSVPIDALKRCTGPPKSCRIGVCARIPKQRHGNVTAA